MSATHRFAIYTSHGLAAWGQRMWEFSVALVLLHQFSTSFAAVAASGCVISLAQAFGGAAVGEFLDRYDDGDNDDDHGVRCCS